MNVALRKNEWVNFGCCGRFFCRMGRLITQFLDTPEEAIKGCREIVRSGSLCGQEKRAGESTRIRLASPLNG
jgi:hypothetical protein